MFKENKMNYLITTQSGDYKSLPRMPVQKVFDRAVRFAKEGDRVQIFDLIKDRVIISFIMHTKN